MRINNTYHFQNLPKRASMRNIHFSPMSVIENCDIGDGTVIWHHCNLYLCKIGRQCEIGSFVEIGEGVIVGDNCKILPYAFLCPGVKIGSRCFIGPHVSFSNDRYPTVIQKAVEETIVGNNVNIGAGTIIISGNTICDDVTIGAGSLVTKDITESGLYYGSPATKR